MLFTPLMLCQGADLFEKDYFFMSVHDYLHWTLIIVCHAGALPEDSSRTSWTQHLDSMAGVPSFAVFSSLALSTSLADARFP